MESNSQRPQNMIDTTDALEAVSACQTMKNFLFLLIFLGLLVCQIVFWMNYFGLVKVEDGLTPCPADVKTGCPVVPSSCPISEPQAGLSGQSEDESVLIPLAATVEEDEPSETTEQPEKEQPESEQPESEQPEAEQPVSEAVSNIEETIDQIVDSANEEKPDESVLMEKEEEKIPAEIPTEQADPFLLNPQTPDDEVDTSEVEDILADKKALFRISGGFVTTLVTFCNYVVLIAAVLYTLTLLICLKISLVARLGGINHIVRAFFVSLFLLVILIPWQTVLPGVLIGAIWRPEALWSECWGRADGSLSWKVFFHLRFGGLWVLSLCLLLLAQTRSSKWAKATLRRLGVVR